MPAMSMGKPVGNMKTYTPKPGYWTGKKGLTYPYVGTESVFPKKK